MKTILTVGFLIAFSTLAQKEVVLPPIEGEQAVNAAPSGWTIMKDSPDIITGNGFWSSSYNTYWVNGVNGDTTNGNMAFFIALPSGYSEGWKTTASKLTVGETYSVSFQWQQVRYYTKDKIWYAGGGLAIGINGKEYTYDHDSFEDSWHNATVVFEADSTDVEITIRCIIPKGGCEVTEGCAIVVENVDTIDCQECKEAGAY